MRPQVQDQDVREDGAMRSRNVKKNGVRLSRFVFTVNGNHKQLDWEYAALKTLTPKWLIVGRETCPTTGRKHLQGACVLGKQTAFATIKSMPGFGRAHIEPMRGTPEQSRVYCTKEDKDAYEYGVMPAQGKRNDLHEAVGMLREGKSIREIVKEADVSIVSTFVRYPKGLTTVSQMLREDARRELPFVLWLHGVTGTGKTRSAFELAEYLGCSDDIWISNASLQWFDGYNGQRYVILDDYRTNHAKFSFILRLLDRYTLAVPYKGGFTNWQPYIIVVTTPKSARATWNLRTEEDIRQLERRLTVSIDTDEFEDSYEDLSASVRGRLRTIINSSGDKFRGLAGLLPPLHGSGDSGDGVGQDSSISLGDTTSGATEEQCDVESSGECPGVPEPEDSVQTSSSASESD